MIAFQSMPTFDLSESSVFVASCGGLPTGLLPTFRDPPPEGTTMPAIWDILPQSSVPLMGGLIPVDRLVMPFRLVHAPSAFTVDVPNDAYCPITRMAWIAFPAPLSFTVV